MPRLATNDLGGAGAGPAAEPNPAPATAPSLRQWQGEVGTFALTPQAAIGINSRDTGVLSNTAAVFRDDLKLVSGQDCKLVPMSAPQPGSFFLSLSDGDPALSAEGYLLEIGPAVVARANSETGVFYATQTILQMLKLSPKHAALPRGQARDYPLCKERCEMIDVGRRYFQVSYLEEEIRNMAWHKLNMLHLHFSDWNGFRLVSDISGPGHGAGLHQGGTAAIQHVARRYHVVIVPEIDLPAHAKAITDYNPKLRFACASMDTGHWPGAQKGGWMLDITRPEVRAWIKALLEEFIPLFDGPYFHIGCDEWEYSARQWDCPELVAYMKAKGYPVRPMYWWNGLTRSTSKSSRMARRRRSGTGGTSSNRRASIQPRT